MKKVLAILALVATTAQAGLESGPREYYDMTKLITNQSTIVIHTVPGDITEACNRMRKSRGERPFNFPVEACSNWQEKSCHIYIGERTNNDILGHEVHHCFAGAFH